MIMIDLTFTCSVAVVDSSCHLISHRVIKCRRSRLRETILLHLDYLYNERHFRNIYAASCYLLEFGCYKTFIYNKLSNNLDLCEVDYDDLPL